MTIDGQDIAEVAKSKYIEVMLNKSGNCDDEIEQRIGAASKVVGARRKLVLDGKELKNSTKMRVYNAMVLPTMLYGCETWTLQKRHEGKLQALEMRYLRRVGVTRVDRVRNEDVRQAAILDVKAKQIAWKIKLEQMNDDRLVNCVYEEDVPGKRQRGCTRKRWHENFK